MNSRSIPPITICQPAYDPYGDGQVVGYDCDNGTMDDPFHATGDNDPYLDSEKYCYTQLGSPPYPVDDQPDPPPEEPPFDPYHCDCPAHRPNKTLLFLVYHPLLTMTLSALATGLLLYLVTPKYNF